MAKQTYVVTQEGYNELKEELNYLKNVRRAEIIHDIEVARGFGDLSENAEYDEARTEQAKVEARIKELEERLRNAEIVDEAAADTGVVSVGSTVVVYDPEENEETAYAIVGSNEINVFENRISDLSPIGKALIGHHAGSTVTVETPRGSYQLEIRSVERTRKN